MVAPHVSEGTVLYGLRRSVSRDSSGRAVNIVVMANPTSVPQTRVLIADDEENQRAGLAKMTARSVLKARSMVCRATGIPFFLPVAALASLVSEILPALFARCFALSGAR